MRVTLTRMIALNLLLFAAVKVQSQTTIVTGTIKDRTNTVATSGKVTFRPLPSTVVTTSVEIYTSQTIECAINASGQVKHISGAGNCLVTYNTLVTPAGSYYEVCFWPNNVKTACMNWFAYTSTQDLSTIVPTPSTMPGWSFVDLVTTQTITGNKTFSGTVTFSGSLLIKRLASIRVSSVFDGASVGAKIDAACNDLGGSPGLALIPSDAGAGNSLIGITDNCRVLDIRQASGPNELGTEGQGFLKGVLLRARYTTAPLSAQNYQPFMVHTETSGGYNNAGGPKTNYTGFYVQMLNRGLGQHTGIGVTVPCYSQGDCFGHSIGVFSYGGCYTAGDECDNGLGVRMYQGYFGSAGTPSSSIAQGTVASKASNTITISSPSAMNTVGEQRVVINTNAAKVYSTGTVTSIAGTPPIVTCSGCDFAAQFGTGVKTNLFFELQGTGQMIDNLVAASRTAGLATYTTYNNHGLTTGDVVGVFGNSASGLDQVCTVTVTGAKVFTCPIAVGTETAYVAGIVTTNKAGWRYVVPVRSVTDATHLVLDYVFPSGDGSWAGSRFPVAGPYKVYKGSRIAKGGIPYWTGATGPTTLTLDSAADFAAADTFQSPLGYSQRVSAITATHANIFPGSGGFNVLYGGGAVVSGSDFGYFAGYNGNLIGYFQHLNGVVSGVPFRLGAFIGSKVFIRYEDLTDASQVMDWIQQYDRVGTMKAVITYDRGCSTNGCVKLAAGQFAVDSTTGEVAIGGVNPNTGVGHVWIWENTGAQPQLVIDNNNGGTGAGIQVFNNSTGAGLVVQQNSVEKFKVDNTGVSVGGGAKILKTLSTTSVIDFAAVAASDCVDSAGITLTGAVDGDVVEVGTVNAVASIAGLQFTAYTSAADTVKVRACNVKTSASSDPASATFRVSISRY